MAPGHVRAKSPVRTPARKSVVGSPKAIKSPPPPSRIEPSKSEPANSGVRKIEFVQGALQSMHLDRKRAVMPTPANGKGVAMSIHAEMTSPPPSVKSPPPSMRSPSPSKAELPRAVTYADQMESAQSKISSDHAPPQPDWTGISPPKRATAIQG